MPDQVLARKWRPRRFDEVVGQPHVVQALSNALNQKYLHHAYLFTGTRGVGKTTIARIIAKCLNCEKGVSASPCDECNSCQEVDAGRFPDLYEVDAASRTKVEDTRELLENVQYAPTKGRYKVYLIDEVHMLSGHSFNALLKTLEEPPPHVKFLLATTDYHKLPATVLSRCLQFHLTQMSPQQIAQHLNMILQQENITHENQATELLGRTANGSMRDALSLLDQSIAYGNGKVLINDVKAMLGTIEPTTLLEILHALHAQDGNMVLACVAKLTNQGVDFSNALADLLSLLHQIAVIQAVPDTALENDSDTLRDLAAQLGREDVQLFYQIGLLGQRDFPFAPTPHVGFEMTLLRMLAFYPNTQADTDKQKQTVTKPIKTPQTTAATTTQNPSSHWNELLPQLNLTGAALALARQCSLQEMTDSHLHLILNPKQKPLLQKKQIQRISETLNAHFNRAIIVNIEIGAADGETPAVIAQREERNRQTKAESAIMEDQQVQRIMKTFDATVVKDSIIPSE